MNEALGSRSKTLHSASSLAHPQDVFAHFEQMLRDQELFAALRYLNSTTTYRFTGIYYFEPGIVKSLVLADRENPDLRVGGDVPWFDSYCMMTAENGKECEIQNALADERLRSHAARKAVLSYCAVLLRMPDGEALGTLCHYDIVPRNTAPMVLEGLRACTAPVERYLWEYLTSRPQPLPRD